MRAILLLASTVAVLLPVTALSAAGGGGGGSGGSSMPSSSVPQFDAAAEYRKGVAALEAKRYAEAKSAFAKVLRVMPKDAGVNYAAGLSHAGLEDWKGAKKHYEKAVRADAAMVFARRELALTYARLGERPKAEAELAILKADWDKCATTCAKAGDLKGAVDAVTAALAGAPQARAGGTSLLFASAEAGDQAYLDAVGLINEGRYEAAIAALDAARTAFGAHPDVLTYLGFANRKLKRFDVAEGYYRAALAAAPEHRGATEYFGELMVERGDLAGAKQMLAKLDRVCAFGCAEADELRRWIDAAS